jgi:hypothetical protein
VLTYIYFVCVCTFIKKIKKNENKQLNVLHLFTLYKIDSTYEYIYVIKTS